MGGRTLPTECEHGRVVDGGGFMEAETCKFCEAKYAMSDYCNYPDCNCPIDKTDKCLLNLPEETMETDYQPTEQAKVRLYYAQTEMRRADPWEEFEWNCGLGDIWFPMTAPINLYNSSTRFRRKPRTVKLIGPSGKEYELPAPKSAYSGIRGVVAELDTGEAINHWLAALREIAGEP